MPFVTPKEIADKAVKAYPGFLKDWIRGEGGNYFPHTVRGVDRKFDPKNFSESIKADEKLQLGSLAKRGWGYTVNRKRTNKQSSGKNPYIESITIKKRGDFLRLAKKVDEFAATGRVVERVRAELPPLEGWLVKHVNTLHKHAEAIEGLIGVAQYFLKNPWPDCYLRQIPVPVDTKFIENHTPVLVQWLDALLPVTAYDPSEKKFAQRYGLRDGPPHQALRVLDPQLQQEIGLPFDELSLPLKFMATLSVQNATAVIVENDTNLFLLPAFPRGIGIRGNGNAVVLLERLKWLATNRILYWGDFDVDGFMILSRLRNLFPHTESIMMDFEKMPSLEKHLGGGNGKPAPPAPTNLTSGELAAFEFCSLHNYRLEQEKIPPDFVERAFADMRQ